MEIPPHGASSLPVPAHVRREPVVVPAAPSSESAQTRSRRERQDEAVLSGEVLYRRQSAKQDPPTYDDIKRQRPRQSQTYAGTAQPAAHMQNNPVAAYLLFSSPVETLLANPVHRVDAYV